MQNNLATPSRLPDPQIAKMDSRVPKDIGDVIINALHMASFNNEDLEAKIREFVFMTYDQGFVDGLGAEWTKRSHE